MKLVIPGGVLIVALLLLLSRLLKEGKLRSLVQFLPFLITQCVLWVGSYMLIRRYGSESHAIFLSVSAVLCLLSDAALILAIRRTERNAAMHVKNRQMEELLTARERYYAALRAKRADMCTMHNDIARSLTQARELLESGETAEAAAGIDALNRKQDRQTQSRAGGGVVESFVEQRRRELAQKELRLESSLILPMQWTGISDVDIICAVGNLLDNAEEACEKKPGAVIGLKLCPKGDYLCVSCTNPGAEEKKTGQKRRVAELDRGLGLSILRELARQKDGELAIRSEDGFFRVDLLLKTACAE